MAQYIFFSAGGGHDFIHGPVVGVDADAAFAELARDTADKCGGMDITCRRQEFDAVVVTEPMTLLLATWDRTGNPPTDKRAALGLRS